MDKLIETVSFLEKQGFKGEVGVILGTGLGGLIQELSIEKEISYDYIPNFPVSTVESHHGKLILSKIGNKKAIIMQGRFHYYEGYSFQEITFPIRVMKLLGVEALFVSNAAGAVNLSYSKGDLMLIDDHINFLPGHPLIGKNDPNLGPRFPDMSCPYSPELNAKIELAAISLNIPLQKGVYMAVSGPTLETRAEYRMMKIMGTDAVGMSTVPEVIVANHMSLPVAAVSVITDIGDPDNLKAVNLDEIIAVAKEAEKSLTAIFLKAISSL